MVVFQRAADGAIVVNETQKYHFVWVRKPKRIWRKADGITLSIKVEPRNIFSSLCVNVRAFFVVENACADVCSSAALSKSGAIN